MFNSMTISNFAYKKRNTDYISAQIVPTFVVQSQLRIKKNYGLI